MKPGQVVIVSLAAGCGVLATAAALLFGGVGQSISPEPPLERSDWVGAAALDGEEFGLAPMEGYAEITTRPLFNENRQPAPPAPDDDGPGGPDIDDQPAVELNVTVTGIIITPEKKLAMVVDNATQQVQRLTEGMPLEGEQSTWTLTRIEARSLLFDGGGSEPREVELETYTRPLKGGAPARARATPVVAQQQQLQEQAGGAGAQAEAAASQDDRAARAEEIRRRVAERRAQLREEAERRREEQQQENDNE